MPHFFINSKDIHGGILDLYDKETLKHLVSSLRIKAGEKLLFIDENEIQYETQVIKACKEHLRATVEKFYPSRRKLDFKLNLIQCVLKNDAQNNLISAATQMGVSQIFPVLSKNCALSRPMLKTKVQKWQKIAYESSKQCERADIPVIREITSLSEILQQTKPIVFAEKNADAKLRDYVKNEEIYALIGPEGGFCDEEFELFNKLKLPLVSLGNLILKADTAVVCALADIIYEKDMP